MASIDRSDPVILGHVLAEHRDLFNLMHCVRSAFATADLPTTTCRSEVRASLRDLRTHLADHFAREEQGGFLEEAVARVPRLAAATRSILSQHPALLAELDRLIADLAMVTEDAEAWRRIGRGFEAFSAHMAAHERSENSVVQEGYNEDLGLGD